MFYFLRKFFVPKIKNFQGNSLPNWKKIKKNFQSKDKIDKKILIATSSGGLLNQLVSESLFANALQSKGCQIEFILCDEILPACVVTMIETCDEKKMLNGKISNLCATCFSRAKKNIDNMGFKTHKFSKYIDKDQISSINQMNFDDYSFKEIINYEINGIKVGQHAYSATLRYYGVGDLEVESNSKKILIKYLKASIISKIVFENFFNKKKYDHILINSGLYVPQGILTEIAAKKGMFTTTWEFAYKKFSYFFSKNQTFHTAAFLEKNSNWENLEMNQVIQNRIDSYLKSRWEGSQDRKIFIQKPDYEISRFFESNNFDLSKPIIGLATNLIWDAKVYYEDSFLDSLEWVDYTIKYFYKRTDLNLVIRIHPAEVLKDKPSRQRMDLEIKKKFEKLPNNILVVPPDNSISTYKLFEHCNSVITYCTKMGVELTATGLPVIVCGNGPIRNKKIAIDVSSENEYKKVLDNLPFKEKLKGEKLERAKKYAYHFFFRKTIQVKSLYEKKHKYPSIGIKNNLFENLNNNKDLTLEKIADQIINNEEIIYNDEDNL